MKRQRSVLFSPAWHPYMYALWPSYLHRHLITLFKKSDSAISIEGFTSTCQKTQSRPNSFSITTAEVSSQLHTSSLWAAFIKRNWEFIPYLCSLSLLFHRISSWPGSWSNVSSVCTTIKHRSWLIVNLFLWPLMTFLYSIPVRKEKYTMYLTGYLD